MTEPLPVWLSKNGNYWLARWRDRTGRTRGQSLGKRKDAGGPISKRTAQTLCQQLANNLMEGRISGQQAPGLAEHCARFLEHRPNLAEGTVVLYRKTIRYLVGHFGAEIRLDAISRVDAADWRAALAAGQMVHLNRRRGGVPSEATVCQAVRDAKAIFQWAVDQDLIPVNPFGRLVGTAPEPDKSWAYVDVATIDRLLDACPSTGWRLLLGLARFAGLRQGEALALGWSKVDLVAKRLLVANQGPYKTTKKRTREVPLAPRLYDLLWQASMEDDASGHQRVCPGLRRSNLWRDFRVICQRAGLVPWPRWCHTLRKNCETDWAGEHPIHVVAEWLGNSPEVAMKRYLKPKDSDFRRVTGLTEPPAAGTLASEMPSVAHKIVNKEDGGKT